MSKRFATLLLTGIMLVAVSLTASSDTPSLPVVDLLGGRYYVYTVKKGDSLFGIARKYGWDDKTLADLNKTAVAPLKKGMLLYYPAPVQMAGNNKVPTAEDTEVRHVIKRGETVYAIANMYGISVDRIYKLNPSSRNGIKAGDSLLIKEADVLSPGEGGNEDGPIFYAVRQGDTLYQLSQRYGVTVAAVMEANPGVNENNFKAGSTVKIPKRGTGISITRQTVEETTLEGVELRQVSKNETWESIAEENGIDEETLKEANPTVAELKNKEYIAVPKVETTLVEQEVVAEDPRETTSQGISEIYEDVHKIADADALQPMTVRVVVVAENPESKKDAEFLRGFLAGIDRLKDSNCKIVFKVVDGRGNSEDVIETLDGFKPTIVFATNETQLPSYLCEYANASRTPLVNTFDVKSEAYTDNPYIIQLLTPSSLFNDNIAHYVGKRFEGYKLLMIGTEDKNDQLADALLALWDADMVRRAPIDAVVPEAFREEGKYLVYGYDVKKGDVENLLERVANVRNERPLAYVSFLARPNLIMFEESMTDEFKKGAVSLPSRFYVDKDSREYDEFIELYKDLFSRMPAKSMPLYAAVGYDTASYFIEALAESRGDINHLEPSNGTVQSDYQLWRPNNWTGLLNPPVYMIDYREIGGINKNVIYYTE